MGDVAPPELNTSQHVHGPDMTKDQRNQVVNELLERSCSGLLHRGALSDVARKYRVHPDTISRLWKRAKQGKARNIVYENHR